MYDRFWWHIVVILHKFAIVVIKTFMFDTFYQVAQANDVCFYMVIVSNMKLACLLIA